MARASATKAPSKGGKEANCANRANRAKEFTPPSGQESLVPVAVVSAETVRMPLASAILGMSVSAMRAAMHYGRWAQGKQWHQAPDGTVWVDIPGVQAWVRGER